MRECLRRSLRSEASKPEIEVVSKVFDQSFSYFESFVLAFVILCGSMIYVLPQRNTKVVTKGTKYY